MTYLVVSGGVVNVAVLAVVAVVSVTSTRVTKVNQNVYVGCLHRSVSAVGAEWLGTVEW